MSKSKKLIGTALQLAYEYDEPGWEHISAMLDLDEDDTSERLDGDDVNDMLQKALKLKGEGVSYQDAEKELARFSSLG
jgi:hypothetical protein